MIGAFKVPVRSLEMMGLWFSALCIDDDNYCTMTYQGCFWHMYSIQVQISHTLLAAV